ncbi:MAG: NAD kinase [Flavobacteriaceae bacterium]|nr:NAD kinase [Flavobacteriaceae bacterium]
MKIAIYGQFYPKNSTVYIKNLLQILSNKPVEVLIKKTFLDAINAHHDLAIDDTHKFQTFSTLDTSFNLLISIGGDGTILRAIEHVKDLDIPIIGLNTGRLGFLATIQKDTIEAAIDQILDGKYSISERSLLSITTHPINAALQGFNVALNEITVSRKNTTSMITVDTYLNNEYLTSYWADGLIVSTPTGSTGYSLSCGGPVIIPEAKNFVITPIAPHNLNARPLIIPDSTVIKLKVHGREEHHLASLDSRIATLDIATEITIKKADYTIKMLTLEEKSFLSTLRKKLLWGEDKRN